MPDFSIRCLTCLVLAAGLAASDEAMHLKVVPPGTPVSAVGRTGLPAVTFKRYVSRMDFGDDFCQFERKSLFTSTFVPWKWDAKANAWLEAQFKLQVNKVLERYGYPTVKKSDSVFDTETKPKEAPLELGVLVRSAKLHLVPRGSGTEGEVFLDVKWALLNAKTQKVVFELPVEASFEAGSSRRGLDFVQEGVLAATRNLLANPAFIAALSQPLETAAPSAAGVPTYTFPPIQPPKGGPAKNGAMLAAAVVTLEHDGGSGTGFYISQDGFLLTNRHVVGEAKFIKVLTATGREMPGEVLCVDVHRDVALVKTARIPFVPLGLRLTDPAVGDEVYTIGSPLGDRFNGTITHGVLSGFRDENKNRFLQSDISVLPGSGGGPLLDANGAVVGVTVMGISGPGGNMNFFIPIADALTTLSIAVKETAPGGSEGGAK